MTNFDTCPDCGSHEVTTNPENGYQFQYGTDGDAVILRCKKPFRVGTCRACDFSWTAAGTPEDCEEVMDETVQDYLSLKAKFLDLAKIWDDETSFLSDMNAAKQHPAYQEIVAMGLDVVPILLEAMRKHDPDNHWFLAINDICGDIVNIPMDMRGRVREMEQLYIHWGLEKGLIA